MIAFIGSQEIILIFFAGVMLVVPLLILAAIINSYAKSKRNSELKRRDDRITALEDKIEKLEKEKAMDERLNSLEKRINK